MDERLIARTSPVMVKVEAGKAYWWCACGRSAAQPFCDRSHKGTTLAPVRWVAGEAGPTWFCACKQTGSEPFSTDPQGPLDVPRRPLIALATTALLAAALGGCAGDKPPPAPLCPRVGIISGLEGFERQAADGGRLAYRAPWSTSRAGAGPRTAIWWCRSRSISSSSRDRPSPAA